MSTSKLCITIFYEGGEPPTEDKTRIANDIAHTIENLGYANYVKSVFFVTTEYGRVESNHG